MTADPHLVGEAHILDVVTYEEWLNWLTRVPKLSTLERWSWQCSTTSLYMSDLRLPMNPAP